MTSQGFAITFVLKDRYIPPKSFKNTVLCSVFVLQYGPMADNKDSVPLVIDTGSIWCRGKIVVPILLMRMNTSITLRLTARHDDILAILLCGVVYLSRLIRSESW